MVGKLVNRTGSNLRGPWQDYTNPASGATDDWSYGVLGAAGMTWDVGNTFHQDHVTFEGDIFSRNFPALNYVAKLAHRPYSLSNGPGIIPLEVNPSEIYPNYKITV